MTLLSSITTTNVTNAGTGASMGKSRSWCPGLSFRHKVRRISVTHGAPTARKELTHDTIYSIMAQFQAVYRGVAEYYQLATNRYQLNRLKWVMERSLTGTLAEKLRIHVSQVYHRYETLRDTL